MLASLPSLRVLKMTDCQELSTLAPLGKLTALTHLELSDLSVSGYYVSTFNCVFIYLKVCIAGLASPCQSGAEASFFICPKFLRV